MVNMTLSEATLNAVRAALDERVRSLEMAVAYYGAKAERDGSEDVQRALVWNIAALHETKTAVEDFAEMRCVDHPVDATWTAA